MVYFIRPLSCCQMCLGWISSQKWLKSNHLHPALQLIEESSHPELAARKVILTQHLIFIKVLVLVRDPLLRELKLWMRRRSKMWACGIKLSPNSLQSFSYATFEKCLKGPKTTEVHMSLCYQLHCFLTLPSGFWDTLQSRFQPLFERQRVGLGRTCWNIPGYVIFIISLGRIGSTVLGFFK